METIRAQFELDRLDGLDSEDTHHTLLVCKRLAGASVLPEFLKELSNDEECLQHILKHSYRHNNGFHKLVLWHAARGHKVRLHWFDPSFDFQEDVHNHRWMFASTIVCGVLRQDHLLECECNTQSSDGKHETMHKHVYNADKSTGAFVVEYRGQARVHKLKSIEHKQGESYTMDTETLHRIVQCKRQDDDQRDGGCITLVITSPPVRSSCKLLSALPVDQLRTVTKPYSKQELFSLIAHLSHMISHSTISGQVH